MLMSDDPFLHPSRGMKIRLGGLDRAARDGLRGDNLGPVGRKSDETSEKRIETRKGVNKIIIEDGHVLFF